MNVVAMPTGYGSAFRPACFVLEGVGAPGGVDIEIRAGGDDRLLGVKRIYSPAGASVNVAPYVRRLLDPAPMCGGAAGIHAGEARAASCYLSAPGFISPEAMLCAGTEDAPANTLLSAAPPVVKIAPGEKDEMGVISGGGVVVEVSFRRGEVLYVEPMGQLDAPGSLAAVIDADAVCRAYASRTGGAEDGLTGFTVRLRLRQTGMEGRLIERRYTMDRTLRTGRRLAWVNRYGAVDYHTFPAAEEFRSGGGRSRIETPAGYRTVATRAEQSLKLLSEPCDERTAEWLSELFSSPAVWMMRGSNFEKVEVASGEVVCSPLQPTVVSVVVSPAAVNVSRKF
jgi:hypothetical protein